MKRGLLLAAVLLAVAALVYFLQPKTERTPGSTPAPVRLQTSPAPSPTTATGQAPPAPSSPVSAPAPRIATVPPAAGAPPTPIPVVPRPTTGGAPIVAQRPPSATGADAEAMRSELEQVRTMIRDYRSLTGENPVGTNAEIMKALRGGNKKGAQLGPPESQLNGQGELLDRWGTAYFFHQLSRTDMEIRSAGPDHVMWTADDQVTK